MEARKKIEKFAHVSSGFKLTSLIPVELRLINSYYYANDVSKRPTRKTTVNG